MKHRRFCSGVALASCILFGSLSVPAVSAETVLEEEISEKETAAVGAEYETETIGEIETYEFTEESAPYEGEWVDITEEFQLYLPLEWEILSLGEQQKERGILFQAQIPTEEEPAGGIMVKTADNGGKTTLAGLGERIEDAGYVYNGLVKMNDIPCAAYTSVEGAQEDVVGIAFFDPSDEDSLLRAEARSFSQAPSELMTVLMSLKSTR